MAIPPQALQAVAKAARDILSHLDLEATLLSIVNAALNLAGADIVGILLAEEGEDVLTMRACTGHRTIDTAHLEVHRGQGVAGRVLETGQPQRVDHYPSDPSISGDFQGIAAQDGTLSALGAPMTVGDTVIGALMLWSRRRAAFTDVHTETLTYLADLATIAIENARLYETERSAGRTLAETHRSLEEQYEWLRRASQVQAELTQLVLEGRGLVDLVAVVAKHTGGKVVIFDPGLTILARSDWAEGIVEGVRRRLQGSLPRRERDQGTSIPPSASFDHWLLVRDVVAGGERLGHLCVGLTHAPGTLDPVFVEQAAIVCALELTKERAVTEARTRVRSDFLWDLLDGNLDDDAEALVRARYLGYTLPDRLRVMLMATGGLDDWARTTEASADAVDRRRESLVRAATALAGEIVPGALTARRGSLIALVMPASLHVEEAKKQAAVLLERLAVANPDLTLSGGLSACVPISANLHGPYLQAEHALSALPVLASKRGVMVFDDLGVLRFLLAPADRGELVAFARKVLGPVMDYDRDHHAELIRTLEVYLASDCSLQKAGEKLFVHPKTVRYRLDRVESLTNITLASQQDRFDAQLATTMIRALSLDDGSKR